MQSGAVMGTNNRRGGLPGLISSVVKPHCCQLADSSATQQYLLSLFIDYNHSPGCTAPSPPPEECSTTSRARHMHPTSGVWHRTAQGTYRVVSLQSTGPSHISRRPFLLCCVFITPARGSDLASKHHRRARAIAEYPLCTNAGNTIALPAAPVH